MLTSVRLVDGDQEMILLPAQDQGIRLQKLDVPGPAIREVSESRVDDDGERDTTKLHGARACSIDLLVTHDARAVEEELTPFCLPEARPYLVVADDEWLQERRLMLRVDQFAAPLGVDLPRRMRNIQAQWKVPDGIWEAAVEAEEIVNADQPATEGRTYPKAYPRSYPATTATGATLITNPGRKRAHFVARLYGPCSGPRLINETTGEQIAFLPSLSLAAGEYLEVNSREHTALLLSMPDASRLGYVDFAATAWWQLQSGEQQIRYAPQSVGTGAQAVITYRPAWL
jgi:hypothetical protein